MSDNTHITTKPNAKPLTKIDSLKAMMAGSEYQKSITNYFSGNKEEYLRFVTSAIDYVRKVPKLLECDRTSLMTAFVTVAQFKFMPSSVSGEMYVIPYGKEAKPQLGYQGIITLLYRAKTVTAITGNVVYKNDTFEFEEGLNPKLIHKPATFGTPKGEAIGCYTIAVLASGEKTFKVMSKDDIMVIKNLSKAKNSADSPWNSNKDPFNWMWLKTCLIQHSKFLPKTPELIKAIEIDNDGEGIEKPTIDAGGPATPKASHSNENIRDAEVEESPTYEPTEEEKAEILRQENEESNKK